MTILSGRWAGRKNHSFSVKKGRWSGITLVGKKDNVFVSLLHIECVSKKVELDVLFTTSSNLTLKRRAEE
jgi:hypothetical protein